MFNYLQEVKFALKGIGMFDKDFFHYILDTKFDKDYALNVQFECQTLNC